MSVGMCARNRTPTCTGETMITNNCGALIVENKFYEYFDFEF